MRLFITVAACMILWAPATMAQEGIEKDLEAVNSLLKQVAKQLDEVRTENATLSKEIEKLKQPRTAAIPSGAVVAFDLPNGCPQGWKDLNESDPGKFAKRAIIVIDPKDDDTTKFGYREDGGEEMVKLSVGQMPVHRHNTTNPDKGLQWGLGGGQDRSVNEKVAQGDWFSTRPASSITHDAGGSQHHNNMPPYIALYFCKKT